MNDVICDLFERVSSVTISIIPLQKVDTWELGKLYNHEFCTP